MTYYLDESGNTGDVVRAGGALGFDQPIFVLACVGVENEEELESEIQRLRTAHDVRSPELKSTAVVKKPAFVIDLLSYLLEKRAPVFIEVMDKKFLLCVNMVNSLIVPPVGEMDLGPESMFVRNIFADYLHTLMPMDVVKAYAEACDARTPDGTRRVYESLSFWLGTDQANGDIGSALRHAVEESRADFEEAAEPDATSSLGLPIPDHGKSGKPFWMLPNLTSFTNIYARINLLHQRAIGGLALIHDEQVQFGHIIESGKLTTEKLADRAAHLSLPHADYVFEQHASLTFRRSSDCIGIQVADIVAGFVMRFVESHLAVEPPADPRYYEAFGLLLAFSDPPRGIGMNFVLSDQDVSRLGIHVTPSYVPSGF
jgi:hypothetical protein